MISNDSIVGINKWIKRKSIFNLSEVNYLYNINSQNTLTLTKIERNIKNYYYNNLYKFIMNLLNNVLLFSKLLK